jgi:predicted kinase
MTGRTPTFHMICGLPGSGKSTLAKEIEAQTGAARFAPDEWLVDLGYHLYDEAARGKVEALQWKLAQRLLSVGVSVILENGFWSKSERDAYREAAEKLNAETRLHYLNVALGELKRRIVRRNQEMAHAALFVDPEDIDLWAADFEAPTEEEIGQNQSAASSN